MADRKLQKLDNIVIVDSDHNHPFKTSIYCIKLHQIWLPIEFDTNIPYQRAG